MHKASCEHVRSGEGASIPAAEHVGEMSMCAQEAGNVSIFFSWIKVRNGGE
jgi:hypothetical protein